MTDRDALAADAVDRLAEAMSALNATPAFGSTADGYAQTTELLTSAMQLAGLAPEVVPVSQEHLAREWGDELERTRDYIPVARFTGRDILFARLRGGDPSAPAIHLTQHYDLPGFFAPAGSWHADASDGWLSSRGVNQCRSGLFAILVAAAVLAQSDRTSIGDVFVSFTPDNHLGGETGAGFLVEEGIGRAGFVITGGASGPAGIAIGYKGAGWIRLTVRGTEGLASQPHLAINAIDKMRTVQNMLGDLAATLPGRPSLFPSRPDAMRAPTLTAARIGSSGIAMPDECVLYLDRRTTPEESMDAAVAEIEGVLTAARAADPDLSVEMELVHAVASTAVHPSELLPTLLAHAITAVRGEEPTPFVLPYYTEQRLFAEAWDAQVIGYGPGRSDATADDDRVSLDDIRVAGLVLSHAVLSLPGSGV